MYPCLSWVKADFRESLTAINTLWGGFSNGAGSGTNDVTSAVHEYNKKYYNMIIIMSIRIRYGLEVDFIILLRLNII
jgi:hypothetical protein